jgi:CheY-like chemotaxis protein
MTGSSVLLATSYATAKTILFVDDEPSILSMQCLVFAALGYAVLTALSGEEALEALQNIFHANRSGSILGRF